MRDPHVDLLEYDLKTEAGLSFNSPPPLTGRFTDFELTLRNEKLEVKMISHYPTGEDARMAVEPFLTAWKLHHAFQEGRCTFSFVFNRAEVRDLDPPELGEEDPVLLQAHLFGSGVANFSATVVRGNYPTFPTEFEEVTAKVQAMWRRFDGYKAGREPLLSMANYCQTAFETLGGGRHEATKRLFVNVAILSQLGEFCANQGGPDEARKVSRWSSGVALTQAQRDWVEAAILALIRRTAQYEAGTGSNELTMACLPGLT
jgi:hypothetical protein